LLEAAAVAAEKEGREEKADLVGLATVRPVVAARTAMVAAEGLVAPAAKAAGVVMAALARLSCSPSKATKCFEEELILGRSST
jgi:hypothetical protein